MNINLGCGEDIEPGAINVDMVDLPGVDIVHNLMEFPYPFLDGMADYIKAFDVIEHLANYTDDKRPSVVAFIDEMYRILKRGGKLEIRTPSYDAEFLWIDPTHVRGFDVRSMDFFDPDTDFGKSTGFYSKSKFKVNATLTSNKNIIFEMIKI